MTPDLAHVSATFIAVSSVVKLNLHLILLLVLVVHLFLLLEGEKSTGSA